jgi:3-deoxy-D-manno-octulosonic-acid transferase
VSDRGPVRPLPAPGAPPPGAPTTLWSARGAATGSGARSGPSLWDRLLGSLFFLAWRASGALALPLLLLHPAARRHIIRLPNPVPGWTWLHGASAGEHTAARALATCVDDCWPTSTSWRTPVSGAFPAPLDLPFVATRWLDRARPGRLVLIEGELWPGWLVACRRRGIPVVVVNARAGRGTQRWRRVGPLWRWLTAGVQFIDQQDTGDLKLSATLRAATIAFDRDVIIAASTREGDEARVLQAWQTLSAPRPMLVIAPRHRDRDDAIAALLDQAHVRWCRRTTGIELDVDVLLLDTMGELSTLYSQARVAFVGGTFDPAIGGHSPAEAFSAGLVVVHGPHTGANPVAWTQGMAVCAPTDAGLGHALRAAMSMGRGPVVVNEAAARCAALLPPLRVPRPRFARPWLAPLVPVWQLGVWLVRRLERPPEPNGIPVVVVGGLVAGGAGRTPAAAWLAEHLEGAWVVSRGYRRPSSGPAVRVGKPDEVPDHGLGDELEMLRRRGIPVVSSPDRNAGVRAAREAGARIVIVDGGLAHHALHRDFTVICVDGHWPLGRGPIPVGQRRLPWATLASADAVWVRHGGPPFGLPDIPGTAKRVTVRQQPVGWVRGGALHPLNAVSGPMHAAAGIARPERFVCTLLSMGIPISQLQTVRDHGVLSDLHPGTVVTEKDAARMPIDADVWALRMALEVDDAEDLLAQLRSLAS